jgi:hypothetical protein
MPRPGQTIRSQRASTGQTKRSRWARPSWQLPVLIRQRGPGALLLRPAAWLPGRTKRPTRRTGAPPSPHRAWWVWPRDHSMPLRSGQMKSLPTPTLAPLPAWRRALLPLSLGQWPSGRTKSLQTVSWWHLPAWRLALLQLSLGQWRPGRTKSLRTVSWWHLPAWRRARTTAHQRRWPRSRSWSLWPWHRLPCLPVRRWGLARIPRPCFVPVSPACWCLWSRRARRRQLRHQPACS